MKSMKQEKSVNMGNTNSEYVSYKMEKPEPELLAYFDEPKNIVYTDDVHNIPENDYSKKTIKELISICREKDIKGYSRKKKTDIINLLISSEYSSKNAVIKECPKINTLCVNDEIDKLQNEIELVGCTSTLQTENTGKIFEMAICLAYDTSYNGHYKYNLEQPNQLKLRLSKLVELFPKCIHTANNQSRYDFTSIDNDKYLSAKSTKKGVGKVSPQVIGQSSLVKFSNMIGTVFQTPYILKRHIQNNILDILPILVKYTFDCPNVYYNEDKNTIRYIELKEDIMWNMYIFKWTRNYQDWKNSSTLKIIIDAKEIALVEFQMHTKSRKNMAIRWCYENVLSVFKENFMIIDM